MKKALILVGIILVVAVGAQTVVAAQIDDSVQQEVVDSLIQAVSNIQAETRATESKIRAEV